MHLQAALLSRGGLGLGHHPHRPHGPGAHHRHAVQVGGEHKVHLLLHIVPQCLSYRPNWDPPLSLRKRVCPSPETKREREHSCLRVRGWWGPTSDDCMKSTLKKHFILCCGIAFQLFRRSRVLQHNCAFYNGCDRFIYSQDRSAYLASAK